jgi:hypothetical protein
VITTSILYYVGTKFESRPEHHLFCGRELIRSRPRLFSELTDKNTKQLAEQPVFEPKFESGNPNKDQAWY